MPSDKGKIGDPYILKGVEVADQVKDFGRVKAIITSEYIGVNPGGIKILGNVVSSKYE